jgi:hypothetical protein
MTSSAWMGLCPRGRVVASAWTGLFSHGRVHVRSDGLAFARMQGCVCTYASRFTRGNFITDSIVRPSHGRPSGHRPSVRLSIIVRVTTLVYRGLLWLVGHTFVTWHALIGSVHVIYYFTMINNIYLFYFCQSYFF